MTMDVAMSLVSGVPSKGGERGGKGANADASGFGEVLAGKADKRMPKDARGKDAEEAPAQWRIGGYDARLAMAMPRIDRTAATLEDALPAATPETPDDGTDAVEAAFATLPAPDATEDAAGPRNATVPAAAAAPSQTPGQRGDKERTAEPALVANGTGETDDGDGAERPAATVARDTAAKPHGAATASQQAATPARPSGEAETAADRQAATPARTGDAAAERPQRPAAAQPDTGRAADSRAQPLAQQAADGAQPRVNVLGFSAAVAPAAPAPLGPTAAGLVATIEAEPAWRAAAAEAAAATGQRGQAPGTVSTLRIQLHPAELGMVTARLTATGSQLEIEIRVESNDARQRLANDSDAILKALRAVGYDVDRVTIQQAPQSGGTAQQQGGGGGRDSFLQGQQQADDNARGRNGQGSEGGERAAGRNATETAAEHAGGGLYI